MSLLFNFLFFQMKKSFLAFNIIKFFQVDDQIRQLNQKLPPDERESAIAIIEHSGPPPDACQAYAELSGVAAVLSMYYALHVGGGSGGVTVRGRGDARGLMRVLSTLPNCQGQRAFDDPFLHTLVFVH